MLDFLRENIVTIITLVILAAIVTAVIVKIIKDKKKGIGSCGHKCCDCPMSGQCHPQQ